MSMKAYKHIFRGLVALLLLISLLLMLMFYQGYRSWRIEKAESYREQGESEKEWILDCQTRDGLIVYKEWKDEPGRQWQTVVPYFSSIAALGLLSGTVTEEQAEGAERYLRWYLDHLNTAETDSVNGDGTIYDHDAVLENGVVTVVSAGDYDSVDSYAAMFLMAADAYAQKVDTELLSERSADVVRVAEALLRTIRENGLSIAKQEYPMQYLMDNTEVYAGLCAGARLAKELELGDGLAKRMESAAERLNAAAEEFLWDEETGLYLVGQQEGDKTSPVSDMSNFYPDSVAQLFPACFGLIDSDGKRAEKLYDDFCSHWRWEDMEHLEDESRFYWCMLAYAAAVQKDEQRLQAYFSRYHAILESDGRGYPLYTGDAGWAALACGYMEGYYKESSVDSLRDYLSRIVQ